MSTSSSSGTLPHHRRAAVALAVLCAAALTAAAYTAPANASRPPGQTAASGGLRIYYRSPVLIRTGDRVRLPVDVACTTTRGHPCRASIALGTPGPSGRWRETATRALPGLRFDVTRPATREAEPTGRGVLSFRLTARGAGRTVSLPRPGRGALRLYVSNAMQGIELPAVRPDRARAGTVALDMPWGTGPRRAGLSPGNESATIGPSSFDVDRRGRIHVLDSLQNRIAVFARGRLIGQLPISVTPQSDLAVARDGTTYVAEQRSGRVRVVAIAPSGRTRSARDLGPGILAELRTGPDSAFARLLPLDAWVPVGPRSGRVRTGLPQPSGALFVSSVVRHSIRLGLARRGGVDRAVELHPRMHLGELALAAPDRDAFVTVFRVLRGGSSAGFQAARVRADGALATFAISDHDFADPMASSRFRLGADGNLYQLATFPDGLRILRYEMGEGS